MEILDNPIININGQLTISSLKEMSLHRAGNYIDAIIPEQRSHMLSETPEIP